MQRCETARAEEFVLEQHALAREILRCAQDDTKTEPRKNVQGRAPVAMAPAPCYQPITCAGMTGAA